MECHVIFLWPIDENAQKEPLASEEWMSSSKNLELHREDGEAISDYSEESERYALRDIILVGSSSLDQVSIKIYIKKCKVIFKRSN